MGFYLPGTLLVTSAQKAKIKWQCRRGMLELDLILLPFVENTLEQLNPKQINALEQLLQCADPEINEWLMGYETPASKELMEIVNLIRFHHHPQ